MRSDQRDVVAVKFRVAVASQPADTADDSRHDRATLRFAKEEALDSDDDQGIAPGAARVHVDSGAAENSEDREHDWDGPGRAQDEAHVREVEQSMASGAAFSGGASQPATERRKAGDGKCYTFDEFMTYYGVRSPWDRAEPED